MGRGPGPDACIDAVGMEAHEGGFIGMYDKVKQIMRLSEAPEGYKMFLEKRDGCMKILLRP